MTRKVTLETEFVVPEEMDEENVRHILSQFFGDLVRTDKFIDARIVEQTQMESGEAERLLDMLNGVTQEDLARTMDAMEDLKE